MRTIRYLLFLVITSAFISPISSQNFDFGFVRDNSIVVKDSLGNKISMPWVGGLNAVHFQQMDLNLDGVLDLLVFDIHGDKLITFINDNITDSASYTYAPQYKNSLPVCRNWIETYDYDNDGKMDIFTHIPGGIVVYRNVSTATNLSFVKVTPMLNYKSAANYPVNIFTSSVDYPAFADIDFDGDMDILTFHILGSYLVWYKNYSMERYGIPDSLEYKIGDKCWGKFAENDTSNSVVLNQTCNYKGAKIGLNTSIESGIKSTKHAGSTVLAVNLNRDTLMDLLLGDVDYFTINSLINGGSRNSALITSQDTLFPYTNVPINLVTFPVVNNIDIDNDGVKEFIVGSFEASYYKPEAKNSVLLYDNEGANNNPVLKYRKNRFFQDRMIDVGDDAAPTLADVDGDGLKDIIIGNYGDIDTTYFDPIWFILQSFKVSGLTYYKNVGTASNPQYQFMDGNWLNMTKLRHQAFKPTFGDLDGDGDKDLLLGSNDGTLIMKKNIAAAGAPMLFDTTNYLNYQNIDVGEFSAPQLIDIDGDMLLDLVIGGKRGYLSYYKNTGTAINPIFTKITDTMGHIRTISHLHQYNGYSVPYFYYDNNDSLKAMVGSAAGFVFYYRNIRANITGNFGLDSNLIYTDWADTLYSVMSFVNEGSILEAFKTGFRSCPIMYDFDNDTILDMMVGGFSGGLNFFKGTLPPGVGFEQAYKPQIPNINAYPNPTKDIFIIEISNYQTVKSMNISVYDISGRRLFAKDYASQSRINFKSNQMENGVYFMKIDFIHYNGERDSKVVKMVKI